MKKFKIEFKWAVIFTLASLLWMFFEKSMGWHEAVHVGKPIIYKDIFGILAIIIYVLALRYKRDQFFNGIMSWKQGFISGAILSIFIAAFTPLSQYIMHTFISPDYFENIISYTVKNGTMELKDAKTFYVLSNYMFIKAFSALSFGIVTGGIVAWFVKKEPKKPNVPSE